MHADHTPPPAYSEQEFDKKISQATTLSLNDSQASLTIDQDGWQQYDPAAFEATEAATEGSSTSPSTSPSTAERSFTGKMDGFMQHDKTGNLPSVVPLRIEKKNQPKSLPKPPAISQPKNQSSSLIIGENSTPALFSSETFNYDDIRTQHHSAQNTYAEDTVMPYIPLTPIQHPTQIAHKHKSDASLSSMPPPPFEAQPPLVYDHYDHDNHYQQYIDPYNTNPSQSARQFPSPPRLVPQERPATTYSSSPNTIQPSYLDFNPSIAYGRTQPVAPSPPLIQPVKNMQFDPHSFYNSSVSAQITPITTGQQGHSSYSSYNSRNSFTPQRQYQQQGSSATYLRPGSHYNQSYVSQDSLSTERSSTSFEINSSRRPVLQSPARPSSGFSVSTNYQTFNTSPSQVYHYVDHTAIPGSIYYEQSAENRWSTQ